jgi:hypothetical protein
MLRDLPEKLSDRVVNCLRAEAEILGEAASGEEFGDPEAAVPVIAHALEGAGLPFAEARSTASVLVEAILPPRDVLDGTWTAMKSVVAGGRTQLGAGDAKYAARRLVRAAGIDRETARGIVLVLGAAAGLDVHVDWRDSEPVPSDLSPDSQAARAPETSEEEVREGSGIEAAQLRPAGHWHVPPMVDFGTVPPKTEAVRTVDVETPSAATVTTTIAGLQLDPTRLAGGRARLRLALDGAHLLPGVMVMGDVEIVCGDERRSLEFIATVAVASTPLESATRSATATLSPVTAQERYRMMLRLAYADGVVSAEERAMLDRTRQDLGLDVETARQLEEKGGAVSTVQAQPASARTVSHPSRIHPAPRTFPLIFYRPRTAQDLVQMAVASCTEVRARTSEADPKEALVGAVGGGILMAAVAGLIFGAAPAVVAGLIAGGVGGVFGSSMPALPRAFSRRDVAQASGLAGFVTGILAIGIFSVSAFSTLLTGGEHFTSRLFGFLLNVVGMLVAGPLIGVVGAATGVLGFLVGSVATGLYRKLQP